jgi:NFU1 iron-sulfur cluster scaffold homolog, mitochondrial
MLSSFRRLNGAFSRYLQSPTIVQARSIFIQTEETPNPESLKFLPGRPVLEKSENNSGVYAVKSEKDVIARSPLMKALFAVEGVKSVYLGSDFVTVTKVAERPWMHVKAFIFSAIMDHFASGKPAVLERAEITDTTILEDDDEVVAMIKELLETRIRPAVQDDGGDIRYIGFDAEFGTVTVQLAGSCVGCPSSSVTLKQGVENMLMHYIPEVKSVLSLEPEEDDADKVEIDAVNTDKPSKQKSYEERLAAAGIPFSD